MKKAKTTHSWFLRDLTGSFVSFLRSIWGPEREQSEQRAAADVDVESRLAPSLAAHAARSGRSVPPGIDRQRERKKEGRRGEVERSRAQIGKKRRSGRRTLFIAF